jgi:hypothetical protein
MPLVTRALIVLESIRNYLPIRVCRDALCPGEDLPVEAPGPHNRLAVGVEDSEFLFERVNGVGSCVASMHRQVTEAHRADHLRCDLFRIDHGFIRGHV